MNLHRTIPRRGSIRIESKEVEEYPHEMQFYTDPPNFLFAYDDLERCAAERLSVLQTIDEVTSRGLKGEEWRKAVPEELMKQDLKGFRKLITATPFKTSEETLLMRRNDHVSHFILRLAYCGNEEKRRWFVCREVDLFRLRWMYLQPKQRANFLKINALNYEIVSNNEKADLVKISNGMILLSTNYYKVSFIQVSDLIKSRKIFVSKGKGYVTDEDIISVITSAFRSNISHSLAYASHRIHILNEDDRIQGILKGASKTQREVQYNAFISKEKIQIGNLDALSQISYPLCMQHLHQNLRNDHHLRHNARQQYGLFLKGIGVTLEDALRFWRSEFTKKMDQEKFEKSYAYNIRHNYGKEGKRANYAPLNCMKIINGSVGPGEQHGCPFKHSDSNSLRKALERNGLSFMAIEEVANLAKKGHYQLACSSFFQHKHNSEQVVINHPNLYFDESQLLLISRIVKKEDKVVRQTATPKSIKPTAIEANQPPSDVWGEDMDVDFSALEG